MLQVKQIVNSIFTSNTYVVFDDEYDYCWIVDIGDYQRVTQELPSGIRIQGLFLTHTHFDHTYGINSLHNHHPECKVFTSEFGEKALYDDRMNFSRYHNSSFIYQGDQVDVLNDNSRIELYPNVYMEVFATPGHCPSCLTYVIGDYIFTGDSYIPNIKVVTKLPRGNRKEAAESICKILHLAEGKTICPGHGEMVKCSE